MSHELLANIWYFILALVWAVYLSQELFVSGVGMLSISFDVTSKKFKDLNESVGTFWDGIQVWLIVAIGGLFAAFPTAYGLTLQALYVPFFLLLMIIILRGTSIELIYKSESVAWRKAVAKIWAISSFALILVLGVYIFNIFVGLPIENGLLTTNFLVIFNKTAIIGGLFFVIVALSLGSLWLKLTLGQDFASHLKRASKWISGASVFALMLVMLALTNISTLFETGPFTSIDYLWALPIASVVLIVLGFVFTIKSKNKLAFVCSILAVITLIFTGFIASFPYILGSTINVDEGLLIVDAAASKMALTLQFYVACVFVPIVIGYQTWKYIKFWKRF